MSFLDLLRMGDALTGTGDGRSPRFFTTSTKATGLFSGRKWKPKPVTAVSGISQFAIPFKLM
jgi:hypothetical protein